MHNLKTERFYKPQMINGRMAAADGPIKTFPLRGIKGSPPYLHDGRLLTLEDTVQNAKLEHYDVNDYLPILFWLTKNRTLNIVLFATQRSKLLK